jgi:hypothetical protein
MPKSVTDSVDIAARVIVSVDDERFMGRAAKQRKVTRSSALSSSGAYYTIRLYFALVQLSAAAYRRRLTQSR